MESWAHGVWYIGAHTGSVLMDPKTLHPRRGCEHGQAGTISLCRKLSFLPTMWVQVGLRLPRPHSMTLACHMFSKIFVVCVGKSFLDCLLLRHSKLPCQHSFHVIAPSSCNFLFACILQYWSNVHRPIIMPMQLDSVPLNNPLLLHYIMPNITPFKQFRQQLFSALGRPLAEKHLPRQACRAGSPPQPSSAFQLLNL